MPAPTPINTHQVAALLAELVQNHPISSAVVCTSDGLAIAYSGLDLESAERLAALFSTLHAYTNQTAKILGRGPVQRVVLRNSGAPVLVLPITGCTYLITAPESEDAMVASVRTLSHTQDLLVSLLPEELPTVTGASLLHRPAPAGAS